MRWILASSLEKNTLDGSGIYGEVFHYAMSFALIGSAALVYFYLWKRGRLDMDEEAKLQMLELDEESPLKKRQKHHG